MGFCSRMCERTAPLKAFAERTLTPLVLLVMRLYVAAAFLRSAFDKLGYVLHGETNTLYSLFEDSYKVPLLPAPLAAWADTLGELGFGVMLALGICARLGALGLIVISGVIYYVELVNLHTAGATHTDFWVLICALIAAHGPGKWSVDAWCERKK